jgi:tape measure domain-containing protein
MTDFARLVLDADTKGLKQGTTELGRMQKQSAQTARDVDAGAASMGAAFKRVGIAAAGALAASASFSEIIRSADAYSRMTAQLNLVTKSTAQLVEVEEKLFAIAQQNRAGFEATVGLYTRIARASETLGATQQQVLQVTDSINKALIISGTTSAEAAGALMQLGQGLASGTLRGDELNSVLEQTPRLAKAIADGMGVPIGELRKLGEQGKLTSDQVFNALLRMGSGIDKEFSKMPVTVEQSFTVMRNELLRFIGQTDQALGASASLAQGIVFLSQNIGTAVGVVASAAAGWGAYRLALLAGAAATAAMNSQMAFNASVALATARNVGVAAGAQVALTGATATATGAFRALTAAMATNPFGAIAVGVGALSAAFIGLANAQRQARAETDNLIRSLDAAIKARGADVAAKRAEADVERQRAQARLTQLEGQLARQRGVGGGFAAQALGQEITDLRWKVVELEGTVRLADRTLKDMEKTAGNVAVPTAKAASAVTALGNSIGVAGGQARAANDDFARLYDRLFPFEAAMRQLAADEMLIRSNKSLTEARKEEMIAALEQERFRNRTAGLGDATVSASVTRDKPLVDIDKAARDYIDTVNDMEGRTKSVTQGIAESFGQMADRTLQALDRLTGAIRGGGFLDILGGVINLGIQLGGMGLFGKSIQANINAPPGRANGGLTSAGRSYLVGERGPELFTPGATGFITPRAGNDNTRISVDASPYFDVRVNGQIVQASPAIMQGGANVAAKQMGRAQSRRVPG